LLPIAIGASTFANGLAFVLFLPNAADAWIADIGGNMHLSTCRGQERAGVLEASSK
jgi:hypothetical protein